MYVNNLFTRPTLRFKCWTASDSNTFIYSSYFSSEVTPNCQDASTYTNKAIASTPLYTTTMGISSDGSSYYDVQTYAASDFWTYDSACTIKGPCEFKSRVNEDNDKKLLLANEDASIDTN